MLSNASRSHLFAITQIDSFASSRISHNHRNFLWLVARGIIHHKMKIVLAGLLCGLLIVITKAEDTVETEYEDPEEELEELEDWELDDTTMDKPTNLEVSIAPNSVYKA